MGLLYINEDAWNACAERAGPPFNNPFPPVLDEAGLRRQVEYYAVPGVTGVLFNVNAMRAFFDSRTFQPLWEGLEERPDGTACFRGRPVGHSANGQEDMLFLCRNLRTLFANVPDPFRVRYEHCRARGLECWLSMRMNDVHHVEDEGLIAHDDGWRAHPEYRRAAFKQDHTFWFSKCFDYGRPEVREHHLALVRELFDRFDLDGLELDWMRSPFHFRPGFAERSAGILTDFMRETRRLAALAAERRGHPVRLSARVPATPWESLRGGMDVFAWAREGLVEMVVPSPYYESSESGLPVTLWRRWLPEKTLLLPCLEQHVGRYGYARMKTDAALDAGFAANYFYQGADGVYLFNHQYRDGLADLAEQRAAYGLLGDRAAVERATRRHVATGHETVLETVPSVPAIHEHLPAGGLASLPFFAGGGTAGRRATVWLAFAGAAAPTLRVWLNGEPCPPAPKAVPSTLPPECSATAAFAVPAGAAHDGENQLDALNAGDTPLTLLWAELDLPA